MLEKIQGTDLANTLYSVFLVIGYIVSIVAGLLYRRKFDINFVKMLLLVVLTFAFLSLLTMVLFWLECGYPGTGTVSIVRAFPYLMFIIWLLSKLLKLKWSTACDFIAPLICLQLGIALIGCVFVGCCKGYPCEWGIYNIDYNGKAFPIQIVEVVAVLIISAFLFWYNKKFAYNSGGSTLPIMSIVFGLTRFFIEFGRNNEKILFECSSISFHALFMVLVGMVVLYNLPTQKAKV